jgi:hypothetical protein
MVLRPFSASDIVISSLISNFLSFSSSLIYYIAHWIPWGLQSKSEVFYRTALYPAQSGSHQSKDCGFRNQGRRLASAREMPQTAGIAKLERWL